MTPDQHSPLHGAASRFVADQRGNVMMLFAFALLPIVIAAGGLIDYSTATNSRQQLNALADAAALAAVSKTAMTQTAAEAQAQAERIFDAQVATAGATLEKRSVSVTQTGATRSVEVSYSAKVETAFMKIAGFKTVSVSGWARSSAANPPYIDFYLLLDNSPSMGVGATTADINKMIANTSDKCAFACHDQSNKNNYYNLAKKLGVQMRIDVVRQASQQLMDTASATQTLKNQFRMAAYTFGASCDGKKLTQIKGISSDLASLKAAANKIDLMTIPKQNFDNDQCTDFDKNLTAIDKEIEAPGDGSSPTKPQKVLYFVADGVGDFYNPSSCSKPLVGNRCQEPIDTNFCKAIKDRGIRIAVLYTTYLPLPTNDWYKTYISPFQSQIGKNMEACASPGLFFEVTPTDGISQAMNALFQKVVSKAYLTG